MKVKPGIFTQIIGTAELMSQFTPSIKWDDPTDRMQGTPEFNAIWNCIKTWDINVPEAYEGYCGATGNHVRAILEALKPTFKNRSADWKFKL